MCGRVPQSGCAVGLKYPTGKMYSNSEEEGRGEGNSKSEYENLL